MEMAHSIEGRVPFLDHHVVELVRALPVAQKIRGMTEKYVLREAVRDVLTDTVYRRQKHPFLSPPVALTPDERLHELVQDTLRGPALASLPFFDQQKVVALLDRPGHDGRGRARRHRPGADDAPERVRPAGALPADGLSVRSLERAAEVQGEDREDHGDDDRPNRVRDPGLEHGGRRVGGIVADRQFTTHGIVGRSGACRRLPRPSRSRRIAPAGCCSAVRRRSTRTPRQA